MADPVQPVSLFEGCRVLDLTDEKGHYCGRVLGDYGADVIKIEPPSGDASRGIGPFYKDRAGLENSLFWKFMNANKRGITMDLTKADGQDLFKRLVKSAHFVVESFKPGRLAELGLDYERLSALKPDLVMTSISPFGQTGPYRDYETTDIVSVAMGGMMRLYRDVDGPPLRVSQPQSYYLGGLHGAVGSTVAHYHREMTGEGQHVDVSIQDAVVLSLMNAAEAWDLLKVNAGGSGPFAMSPRIPPVEPVGLLMIWPCKDGHVLMYLLGGAQAGMVASSKKTVELANAEGFALDITNYDWTRFDMSTVSQEDVSRLQEAVLPFMKTKTKAELFEKALEYNMLIAPATNVEDIVNSPQLAERQYFVQVDHPELGARLTYPGAPVKMSGGTWEIRKPAPLLGEDNEAIYIGELGLSKSDLSVLKAAGVI